MFSRTERIFLKNFNFFETDITDSGLQQLLRVLVENSDVFSKFTYDTGKITQEFYLQMRTNAGARKHWPSNFSSALPRSTLNPPEWTAPSRNHSRSGTCFKDGFVVRQSYHHFTEKRHCQICNWCPTLTSITDLSNFSWPSEPVQMLLTRHDGLYYNTSDLTLACNQVILSENSKKLISFVVGRNQYLFERWFYCLCGVPNFFSRIMTILFAEMIDEMPGIT